MVNKSIYLRFLVNSAIALLVIVIVSINALLIWVATGPRSLDGFAPYIESAFNDANTGYSIKVDQIWLLWDGWKHPIDIRLRNVSILTGEKQVFSTFSEIALGLHIPSLVTGNILPTSLSVDRPVISLFQGSDKSISFGFKQDGDKKEGEQATVPFSSISNSFADNTIHPILRKLKHVSIKNADVSIGSMSRGVFFEADNVEILARRKYNLTEFAVNGKIRYDGYKSPVSAWFGISKNRPKIDGKVSFKGIELSALLKMFSDREQEIPLSIPLSGTTSLTLDKNGSLEHLQFDVDGGVGTFSHKLFKEPFNIGWLKAKGQISNDGKDLQFDELSADVEKMQLSGKGIISIGANDVAAKINASIKDIPMTKVVSLWPETISPMSREWVTENIKGGNISEASIQTNIQFGDLKKEDLPKEAVEAKISLSGAQVRYLPDHPKATDVKAVVNIDGRSLHAEIESANYMDKTKIYDGLVSIENLLEDNPYIKVDITADSTAKDIVHFLDLPRLKHKKHFNLNADMAKGNISGKASVGFNFYSSKDDDIDYNVVAKLTDITHPAFLHRFDLEGASGDLAVDNSGVKFSGSGTINGAILQSADIIYKYSPAEGFNTFIVADGVATRSSLQRFGYPDFEFLQGEFSIKTNAKLGESKEVVTANIDLTETTINARKLAWKKPGGELADLAFSAQKEGDVIHIDAFDLKSKTVRAKGSLQISPLMDGVDNVHLDGLRMGKTNLSKLAYSPTTEGVKLIVEGDSIDLSGFFLDRSGEESFFSFENFPPIELSANINNVIVAGGRNVAALKGILHCNLQRCESANITGIAGDKPFHFRILRNPMGRRQLSIRAQNAGEFLKAFDIYNKMEGGDLAITGNYIDTANDSVLDARLTITPHHIQKAPVLAKILSLASLTGFIDVLQGNGINFERMIIPFKLKNDVLDIKKARAYGGSIGITGEGTITFPDVIFDMKGTVVPAYAANTILGKLPILGKILTGDDGGGVFAGSYKVMGTYEEAKVSVNPLSILTPGFLRGIFNAGDKEKKNN